MDITLGIDVGGSTTKIVCFKDKKCIDMLQVRAGDQITSMYGAIGNILSKNDLLPADVNAVALTGVGASFVEKDIYGIKTLKVSEFHAIGHGALLLTGLSDALIVSMGTGTAFVRASKDKVTHLGGSGVGGGTILGLASQMIGKNDIDAIISLAEQGSLRNVDLSVKDILGKEIDTLPADLTAANFGKIKSTASESDIALGIINMVFETAGMMAVFALKDEDVRDVVITGTLATFPQAKPLLSQFEELMGLNIIIPPNTVFATAFGANALCFQ